VVWALIGQAVWKLADDQGLNVAPVIEEMLNERIRQIAGMGLDEEVPTKSPSSGHLVRMRRDDDTTQ
jgi:hypothetical protein